MWPALQCVKSLNHLINSIHVFGKAAARIHLALSCLARAYLEELQKNARIELQMIRQRSDGIGSVYSGLHSEHDHRVTEQSAEVGDRIQHQFAYPAVVACCL